MAHTGLRSIAHIFKSLLEINGLDAARLLKDAGLEANTSDDPNARSPIKAADALLIRAASLIPDEAWGLKAARCWHPGNLGVLGHAWLASDTLKAGLTRMARYWHIVGSRAEASVDETNEGCRFTYHLETDEPVLAALLPDIALSVTLSMCRTNAGDTLRPVQVTLRRARPADAGPWESFYGCKVQFGAKDSSFTLAKSDADRPLPTANRPLAGVFDSLLTEQLAKLSKSDVVSRCKAEFLQQLASGESNADDIAQRLHMSPRSLQRKLAEVETTYKQLVDETRRDLALGYIADRTKSITDITFLLGFSGQSAFTRAFKRWTGLSPTDYRDRHSATA
ncbi:MAG: AraC family transcriptional regulator [Betaproteobacteria bacterium]|jgi:AraC-like DNA-binding protein|nr:AraC family transcriptional regulator [Betaproteobacteria bacterium]MDH5342041.1 AraC family transcriptional regulator [Betaproteobacteria bacterium]